jgi:hypothetical protein
MVARPQLLSTRGKRLWAALLAQDPTLEEALNPLREVALSACRTADRVEELERVALDADPIIEVRGTIAVHPVHAEVRQQEAALARLITALRLPDEASGKRPQHRGTRGVQKPSQIGGNVSSLEALRSRAGS